MSLDRMMLMRRLKPEDRWRMENMYDGPIPIEVIKNKIASYDKPAYDEPEYIEEVEEHFRMLNLGDSDIDNAYGYKGATEDPRNVVDGEDLEIWERWNK
tara:strand:- start:3327 stop:3623 length:297 start_codon:yes stop_codon:yes gene_type:complete